MLRPFSMALLLELSTRTFCGGGGWAGDTAWWADGGRWWRVHGSNCAACLALVTLEMQRTGDTVYGQAQRCLAPSQGSDTAGRTHLLQIVSHALEAEGPRAALAACA